MPALNPRPARRQASLAALGALLLWAWLRGITPAMIAGLTVSFALLAWVSPPHYAPIYRVLDGLVQLMLRALTWLILGLLYLFLFTPLRVWRILTRQDPLRLRPDPAAATYLQTPPPARPDRFDRQY